MRQGLRVGMLLLGLPFIGSLAHASPSVGMQDTFENLSTDGWTSGERNPNPPLAIAGGGPGGSADGYLLMQANGSASSGGKLISFPGPGWLGDFVSTKVTGIRMQANNVGSTDLGLHFYFLGAGSAFAYTTQAVTIPAASGWTTLVFDLSPAALSGTAAALSSVSEIRLYHNPAAASFGSAPNITASLGIDNVTAVPEPQAWLLFGAGLALIGGRAIRHRSGIRQDNEKERGGQQ